MSDEPSSASSAAAVRIGTRQQDPRALRLSLNRKTSDAALNSVEALETEQDGDREQGLRHLKALLTRMGNGEEPALEELYDQTVAKVYAMAIAILKNREDAEEVVCDTYSQAWNQATRFSAERSTVLGWLTMMCRSRALDHLRQRRRRERPLLRDGIETLAEIPEDGISAEEFVALLQTGSRLRAAIAALSTQRQRFISLAFLEGLSHEEIAARTGTALGTVKSHVRRALVELRAALN